jgi:hypothetical protein
LIKPFLRAKRIAGTGKRDVRNSNWRYAYAKPFVVLAEGLDIFRLGTIAAGRNEAVRQFVLYGKNFGWMDVSELKPEGWD